MAGNRGGKREGAGRKPKDIAVNLEMARTHTDVMKSKVKLLQALHDPEIVRWYIKILSNMLQSNNPGERRDAVKIITDIILKTEVPKEIPTADTRAQMVERLVQELRKGRVSGADLPTNEELEESEVDESYEDEDKE